jgi:hypothetical protein
VRSTVLSSSATFMRACALGLKSTDCCLQSPVPDLTFFAGIQLNARVLLPIYAKTIASIGIGQFAREKTILVSRPGFSKDGQKAMTAVQKTQHDIVDRFQDLEELYQELLALRMRVRRAERANEKRANTEDKNQ